MNLIVLVDAQWGIGCQGEQMVYLTQDLKHFKELTQGCTVVLGRKTMATFPNGKPLAGRRNLILSHNSSTVVEGGEVFSSIESLLQAITPEETVFVIGGTSVYDAFLPLCDTAYVTKVQACFPVDCYFPNLDENADWALKEESEVICDQGVSFSYCIYQQEKVKK